MIVTCFSRDSKENEVTEQIHDRIFVVGAFRASLQPGKLIVDPDLDRFDRIRLGENPQRIQRGIAVFAIF